MLQAVPVADPAAEVTDWWRVVERCMPSHETCGALTFTPAGVETFDADWEGWLTSTFLPVLHPGLQALQMAVAAQDLEALAREDTTLGAGLPAAAAERSLTAGRHLLLSFAPPQSVRLLDRLRAMAEEQTTFGQLAAVFAVRGQIFHLPSVQVTGAFLLAECVLGADAAGLTLPAGRTVALLQGALEGLAREPVPRLLAV